jgi:hypothetical protein
MHHTTSRFWNSFEQLPENIQEIARKNFSLLKNDPSHPSLHFKKVGKLWSVRVGTHHRALAVPDNTDFIWVWIGSHNEYLRLIKQQR